MSYTRLVGLLRRSMFIRPMAFVLTGFVAALVALGLDETVAGARLPGMLHFEAESARLLLGALAGAMLTLTGITFWVRATSVQLTSSQFSPRVVHGFLEDWFQQSTMGALLGIFVFLITVFRVIPVETTGAMPHLSVNAAIGISGGSVFIILNAIRNSVQSMQVEQLARRITDETVDAIRRFPPARESLPALHSAPHPPAGTRFVIRAETSGWVEEILEEELLAALPEEITVRLEVRVGLFVVRGRPIVTVWGAQASKGIEDQVRGAVRLARSRTTGRDIGFGLQQLVDVAVGSMSHGASDVTSVHEVIAHLELAFTELGPRQLPLTHYTDGAGRLVLRPREFTFDDYVRAGFDRLRQASAPYPGITVSLLNTLGTLARDLDALGGGDRAASLRRQAYLAVAASEAAGTLEEDQAWIRRVAERQRVSL